jgi:hypothetical protein
LAGRSLARFGIYARHDNRHESNVCQLFDNSRDKAVARPKYNDANSIVRLPDKLAKQAERKARLERRSLSEVIRDPLCGWLAGDQPRG